jgi:hypothetical protein
MNDDTKKTLPQSAGARRLQSYRRRLREEELARVEILLPKTVREAAQGIADAEGARYLETVSALTQLGLETYQAQTGEPLLNAVSAFAESLGALEAPANALYATNSVQPASFSAVRSFASPLRAQSLASHSSNRSAVFGATSPLARFLKARKEGPHEPQ